MLDLFLFALACFIAYLNIFLGFLHLSLTVTHFLIVLLHHLAVFVLILLALLKLLFVGSHFPDYFRYPSFKLALLCFELIDLMLRILGLALTVDLTLLHFVDALEGVL